MFFWKIIFISSGFRIHHHPSGLGKLVQMTLKCHLSCVSITLFFNHLKYKLLKNFLEICFKLDLN